MGWRWKHWIPACAGTTIQENMQQDVTFEHIHDNPLLNPSLSLSSDFSA